MQKKIIALAIAGLASTAAFAQTNVTIYGVVDAGYTKFSGSEAVNPAAKLKSRTALDHGNQSGSRLGFRGTEDLGNGVTALFVIEGSIGPDTGAGITADRQQFLGLTGNFGTVALGRQYTPQYSFLSRIDPFAGTGVATQIGSGANGTGAGIYSLGLSRTSTIRVDNLAAYVSPTLLGGLTVTAGYTFGAAGNETATLTGAKDANIKLWAVSAVYANGPIIAGMNYHKGTVDAANANRGQDQKVWDVAGSYDFGVAKLGAGYGRVSVANGGAVADPTERQWFVAVSAPVGAAGTVMATYGRNTLDTDVNGASDEKARKWGIGYSHALSKRTNLYAMYGSIGTNTAAKGDFSVSGVNAQNYTRGMSAGIRHSF